MIYLQFSLNSLKINLLTQYDNNNINSQTIDFIDNISLEDNSSLDANFDNQQNELDKNEEGFYVQTCKFDIKKK